MYELHKTGKITD